MHYYSSADEPFLGPLLIFCAPHFNFMELKWGEKKSGGPKNFFPVLRTGNGPPLSICFLRPCSASTLITF